MSRLEDKRAAAKALTPWRDQVSDKIKWFFIKWFLFPGVLILIVVCLSLSKQAP